MSTKPFTHTPRPAHIPECYSDQRWFYAPKEYRHGRFEIQGYIHTPTKIGEIEFACEAKNISFKVSCSATADEMEECARVLIDTAAHLRSLNGGRS